MSANERINKTLGKPIKNTIILRSFALKMWPNTTRAFVAQVILIKFMNIVKLLL